MKNKYIIFTGIGFELIGVILGCLFLGKAIDEKFNSNGLFMVSLSMLGLAGWLFHVVKLAKKLEKNENKEST